MNEALLIFTIFLSLSTGIFIGYIAKMHLINNFVDEKKTSKSSENFADLIGNNSMLQHEKELLKSEVNDLRDRLTDKTAQLYEVEKDFKNYRQNLHELNINSEITIKVPFKELEPKTRNDILKVHFKKRE